MEKCEVTSRGKSLRPLLRALLVTLVLCQISGTFSAAAAGGGTLQDLDAQEILNGEIINRLCVCDNDNPLEVGIARDLVLIRVANESVFTLACKCDMLAEMGPIMSGLCL
jgi:hypothetical protein